MTSPLVALHSTSDELYFLRSLNATDPMRRFLVGDWPRAGALAADGIAGADVPAADAAGGADVPGLVLADLRPVKIPY